MFSGDLHMEIAERHDRAVGWIVKLFRLELDQYHHEGPRGSKFPAFPKVDDAKATNRTDYEYGYCMQQLCLPN
ncbi:hypothetical protein TNIN_281821 [Trichonephila inaurata madagascariensis]|uniref:Uncharacterized protein n=1 Tax=Trichonephila inaurata madagascariensis TaxID=2747483 RepID=A0A8X6YLM8_9ARAC|nr:hypothetical protein TNIN_281821 [Trichonephila inaurata madagascariensis]